MVKRFLMLALALVVLVGIIGCKKNKPEPETPSSTFTPNATEAAPTSAPVQEEETEPEFPSTLTANSKERRVRSRSW